MIETPLEVVRKEMECPKCIVGRMHHTGLTLTSYPPQYPHRCSNCDHHANYDEYFPRITYKEKK